MSTTSTTRLDDVIEHLIATFTTATGLPVKDGPDDVETSATDMLLVGVRLDQSADEFVGDIELEQTFPYVGPRYKEESASIPCSILVWSGDSTARPRRAEAIAHWNACEQAHRTDISLGDLVESSTMNASTRVVYLTGPRGNLCVLTFTVDYSARLRPHEGA